MIINTASCREKWKLIPGQDEVALITIKSPPPPRPLQLIIIPERMVLWELLISPRYDPTRNSVRQSLHWIRITLHVIHNNETIIVIITGLRPKWLLMVRWAIVSYLLFALTQSLLELRHLLKYFRWYRQNNNFGFKLSGAKFLDKGQHANVLVDLFSSELIWAVSQPCGPFHPAFRHGTQSLNSLLYLCYCLTTIFYCQALSPNPPRPDPKPV